MATRMILKNGDPQLRKHCHEVKDFNPRLHTLLDDMRQTLAESNGVGLAAPQVGVLRRAVIVLETNVPDEKDEYMIELINPVIIETAGEQVGAEGCLSVPDEYGIVARPDYVKVRAQQGWSMRSCAAWRSTVTRCRRSRGRVRRPISPCAPVIRSGWRRCSSTHTAMTLPSARLRQTTPTRLPVCR